MQFSNPIVGGNTLIRDSIHSGNYDGSNGWTINRDGTAYFQGLTVNIPKNGTPTPVSLSKLINTYRAQAGFVRGASFASQVTTTTFTATDLECEVIHASASGTDGDNDGYTALLGDTLQYVIAVTASIEVSGASVPDGSYYGRVYVNGVACTDDLGTVIEGRGRTNDGNTALTVVQFFPFTNVVGTGRKFIQYRQAHTGTVAYSLAAPRSQMYLVQLNNLSL